MRRQRSKRHRYISEGTLKSLQKLSYHDLKNLSSEELQKYKRRVGIIEQEQAPEPYTDEDLIRMLRKYTSDKKGINKTKQLTWRARQIKSADEKIKRRLLSKNQKGGKKSKEWSPKPGWKLSPQMLKCLSEPWSGSVPKNSVPKKNTKNKMYDCPMFEDRSKSFVLNGPNKAPKIERDHYLLCYKGMYKDCERKSKKGGCASSRGGGKKTFKSEKKQENVDYYKCIKQKENTRPCNKKRSKTLKRLEKRYPKEWSQYQKDFMTKPKLRY